MSTAPAYQPLFDRLLADAQTRIPAAEWAEARQEHTGLTGESFSDDRSFASRTQAFVDWFVFDRLRPSTARTPLCEFVEGLPPGADREQARLLGRTLHGLFLVHQARDGALVVENLLTAARYRPAPAAWLATVQPGELFEGRLVPFAGALHFSSAFLFHPPHLRNRILRAARKRPSPGQEPQDLIWTLARMASRVEHFRNIPVESLYDFARPPPRATQPAMRFDAASVAERRARLAPQHRR